MHLKISRANLFHQIQRCQNIVEKRNTNPILVNILFETVNNGLKITATDLQATYASTQEAEILESGRLTVDAKKIFDIVRELNPEQIIELKTKPNFLEIFSGGVLFEIAAKSADEFPGEPADETDLSISLPGIELIRMISSTSFAMSNDETRKYLTGSLFDVSPEHGIRIVTTDGHRMALSEFHLTNQHQSASCILPKKAVLELKRLAEEAEGDIQLSLGQHQVQIILNQQRFTSKVIDAKYPVYQDVIPKTNPYTALVDKNLLDQALRRSMVVSNDFTHDVKLVFSPDKLSIGAHNADQEHAEEDIVIGYTGSEVEVGFNAKYMRDVLGAISSQNVRIVLKDSLSPALLLEEGHELSKHVLMPMRI